MTPAAIKAAESLEGKIAVIMGDNRERTVDEICALVKTRPDDTKAALRRMERMGLLIGATLCSMPTYRAKQSPMTPDQADKFYRNIPFKSARA